MVWVRLRGRPVVLREEDENADAPLDGQVGRRAADVDVAHVVATRRVAEELQLGALKQRPARGLREGDR